MGSSGKKRTTMAKLNRESKLRDKRADKEARKTARKLTAAGGGLAPDPGAEELGAVPIDTDDDHLVALSGHGVPTPTRPLTHQGETTGAAVQ